MSGAGRKTIYKDMKTGAWPNGLTVDHFEKRIVWTDARFNFFFPFLFYNLHQIILTKLKCVFLCMYHVHTLKLMVNFVCFGYDSFFVEILLQIRYRIIKIFLHSSFAI